MQDQDRWTIQCLDTGRRIRDFNVFVTETGDVVLQAPPGEIGVIAPHQVAPLKDILDDAATKGFSRKLRRS